MKNAKIAILVPGNDRLDAGSGSVDARIHPLWRRLYEQINKHGVVAEYLGPGDIAEDRLAGFEGLFVLSALRLTQGQEQVISRFVRSGRGVCLCGVSSLAGSFGITIQGRDWQKSLVWQGKTFPYRVGDERGFTYKALLRLLRGPIPIGWVAALPAARVSVSADHEILARWQSDDRPALTCSRAWGGSVIYFSGILTGADEALIQQVIFLLVGNEFGKAPVLPPGKKCGVTLFHDYEGIYGDHRRGSADAAGVLAMLALEKKYQVRATFNIVGKLAESAPETIRQIIADGHEIAAHTYEHTVPRRTRRPELEGSLRACRRVFQERWGREVVGFRAPQSAWSADLVALLAGCGFAWDAEDEAATLPYRLVLDRQLPLLRLPVTGDDYAYISARTSPRAMLTRFKTLIAQGIAATGFVSIGFHPWIEAMEPERLRMFEEFLVYLTAQPEVAVMTFGEVSAWWNQRSGYGVPAAGAQPPH